jgi:glycosyltransferase involved in cell wall biosynthesis
MKQKLAVAMIEPIGGHGGMHYYDFGLCRGLLDAGCGVSLYTCDETVDPAIPGLGFFPYFQRIYGHGNRWMRGLRYFMGTWAALKRAAVSGEMICHFHAVNAVIPELVVITLARLFGRKTVLTVHDVSSLAGTVAGKRRLSGFVYRLADGIIVHNEVSRRELESLGVPSGKINVIPHGHCLDSTRKMPSSVQARRTLGIETAAKVVLFFGQIKDAKGLDFLIEALPKVVREVPEVVLLIAGRPWRTQFAKYDALIDKLGVRARCCLHIRFIPDDEVSNYYAAADVVALPYRRIYQSGVLIMAMSYGRPVVVSDLPGMTEMITDGVNGYVFPNGSKEALADALIRALQSDNERGEIGARAMEYVRQYHSWNQIGVVTAQLYRSLLSSRVLPST